MKFLGIDYGTKRIGLAVSDDDGRLAFPKTILPNDKAVFNIIGDILKTEGINEVVVGDSLDSVGAPNPVSAQIEGFAARLKDSFSVKTHKEKEFFTTLEARRYREDQADARAAALILQRFLDRRNKKGL